MYICVEVDHDAEGKIKGHPRVVVVLDYGDKKPDNLEDIKAMLYEAAIHLPTMSKIKIAKLRKPGEREE